MTNCSKRKTPLILIVDDDWMNREMMETQLRYANYQVTLAHSGGQALEIVTSQASQPPDLVLLDVRLQDMSGFEVCKQIKADARTQSIPVLLLTALKVAEDKHRAGAVSADGILTKPFIGSELVAFIEKLLERKPNA